MHNFRYPLLAIGPFIYLSVRAYNKYQETYKEAFPFHCDFEQPNDNNDYFTGDDHVIAYIKSGCQEKSKS